MFKPEKYLNLLLYYQLGLENDLIDKEDVMKWVESIIEKDGLPDYSFIELSLSKSKSQTEIAHFISEKYDFKEPLIAYRALLGLLSEFVIWDTLSISEVLSIVYNSLNIDIFTPFEKEMFWKFEFELNALEFGETFITENQLEFKFERFLSIYSILKEDNFESWLSLNEEIPSRLIVFKEHYLNFKEVPKSWWKKLFKFK